MEGMETEFKGESGAEKGVFVELDGSHITGAEREAIEAMRGRMRLVEEAAA